jgi:hypothetical protein
MGLFAGRPATVQPWRLRRHDGEALSHENSLAVLAVSEVDPRGGEHDDQSRGRIQPIADQRGISRISAQTLEKLREVTLGL